MELFLKALIGGVVIAVVSTVTKKQPTLGAFLMGIPFASFVALIFMYYSNVDVETFKTFSYQTIYFVLISLLFFVIFAGLLSHTNFWISLLVGAGITGFLMLLLSRFL